MTTTYNIDPAFVINKPEDSVKAPVVITVTDFTEDSANAFLQKMSDAHNTSQPVIPIVINSYGGQVHALTIMVDAINASRKPVATVAVGKAMSCGAVLLSCGANGMRFMAPSARVMIHDVSMMTFGKVGDVVADTDETKHLQAWLLGTLDRNCGKPDGYFDNLIHERGRADWYLGADECVEHGLVSKVGMPRFNVEIKTKIEFVKP